MEGEHVAEVLGPIGELAAHAAGYAETGLDVFPVNPHDKAPLISQYKATTDLEQIDRWWHDWPTALIGHRLPADQIILDIDPRHGGRDTWMALRDHVGDAMPVTRYHASGRGDGGGHLWWLRPDLRLSTVQLDAWAEERGHGHAVTNRQGDTLRWSGGIDILQHTHRYTILPPSPHPDTGKPYQWVEGRGLTIDPAPLPAFIADLISDTPPPPKPAPRPPEPHSIADWYSANARWSDLLGRHGWRVVAGDGDTDGSRWKHPTATSAVSATIRHGCLFVYSTSTAFEPTEPGGAHGYTLFRAFTLLEHNNDGSAAARAARELRDGPTGGSAAYDLSWAVTSSPPADVDPDTGEILDPPVEPLAGPQPIDWPAFWGREHIGEDWIVEPLIPRGRQVALWAMHKTGKSLLSLEVAAAVATGQPCLRQPRSEPQDVVYIDLEMTEDDLHDRLEEMGYGPDDDLSKLHYYLLPSLPPLDSAAGGIAIVALVDRHHAQLVVVDTMARAVEGDENDADTYRAFYRHTGLQLKQRGCALIRLDHAGKDPTRGQRGSSSKGDDVDVVWQLHVTDDGLGLRRTAARMSWVPETVAMRRTDSPLRHELAAVGFKPGTRECVTDLERLGVPITATQREAAAALKAAGVGRKTDVIRDAIRHRRTETERHLGDLT